MLASFGIYNLVYYDAGVFVAFNPGEAFSYLARNKEPGWHSLSGVLLCFTGVEALFADLGAFSKRAIQISWFCWCLPCLLLTYIGQAAYISVHPEVSVLVFVCLTFGGAKINACRPTPTLSLILYLLAVWYSRWLLQYSLRLSLLRRSQRPRFNCSRRSSSRNLLSRANAKLINWTDFPTSPKSK